MNQYFFEDLSVGQSESLTKTVTAQMVEAFAELSGDNNPLHLDADYAASTRFKERIAHGALSTSFISAVLGTLLPGVGAVFVGQSVRFLAPVKIEDLVKATVVVDQLMPQKNRVLFNTACYVGDVKVVAGEAEIYVPSKP